MQTVLLTICPCARAIRTNSEWLTSLIISRRSYKSRIFVPIARSLIVFLSQKSQSHTILQTTVSIPCMISSMSTKGGLKRYLSRRSSHGWVKLGTKILYVNVLKLGYLYPHILCESRTESGRIKHRRKRVWHDWISPFHRHLYFCPSPGKVMPTSAQTLPNIPSPDRWTLLKWSTEQALSCSHKFWQLKPYKSLKCMLLQQHFSITDGGRAAVSYTRTTSCDHETWSALYMCQFISFFATAPVH
jgi:hypothetical protein